MKRLTRKVTAEYAGNEETELEVVCFPDDVEPAKASVSLGGTINLGNFNNAKFHVSVTLPCYAEEIEGALDRAQEIAEERCDEITKKLTS